ncbi:SDR family NAD(P)-dependent oxidoreductase [Sphingomonas sp. Root710]|uniref:SDR family NAD(P)-dependent oxidoreductase n=1 Tax=Sphingomonas sp. Root710 TaxID=1736594 RepID=UPI0009EBBE6C|nr:SDR family NAD(P)-dependent oxidoreductase [Sphingomonas sp. Root710]
MPKLALAYLRDRALTNGLNILLLALAVATLVILLAFSTQLGKRFERDAAGIDLVVGAKGSPLHARAVQLDVTDDASVSRAAAIVEGAAGKLDVLVNNAGIMFVPPSATSDEPIDEIRQMFETNVFGALRVTQAFLPLLRKSQAARIVMMSSGLSSLSEALDMRSETWTVGFAGYCASKSALNMFTVKLAKELDREGIKVNAVDPGLTSTDITANGPGHSPDQGARPAVALATTHAYGPIAGLYACTDSGDLLLKQW